MCYISMERSTIFNGKIQYFNGHFPQLCNKIPEGHSSHWIPGDVLRWIDGLWGLGGWLDLWREGDAFKITHKDGYTSIRIIEINYQGWFKFINHSLGSLGVILIIGWYLHGFCHVFFFLRFADIPVGCSSSYVTSIWWKINSVSPLLDDRNIIKFLDGSSNILLRKQAEKSHLNYLNFMDSLIVSRNTNTYSSITSDAFLFGSLP